MYRLWPKFKASCLAVIEKIRKTKLMRVTRFGKPMADVLPPSPEPQKVSLGFMAGRGEIHGDIVHASPWLDAETNGSAVSS